MDPSVDRCPPSMVKRSPSGDTRTWVPVPSWAGVMTSWANGRGAGWAIAIVPRPRPHETPAIALPSKLPTRPHRSAPKGTVPNGIPKDSIPDGEPNCCAGSVAGANSAGVARWATLAPVSVCCCDRTILPSLRNGLSCPKTLVLKPPALKLPTRKHENPSGDCGGASPLRCMTPYCAAIVLWGNS